MTAFTLAHSVTLSLAALNLVSPPEHLIEPAIALSIIYVGVDNSDGREGGPGCPRLGGLFLRPGARVRVCRGVAGIGLPRQALGWSLFAFNFGVEVGQACIVVVAASLLAALRTAAKFSAGES